METKNTIRVVAVGLLIAVSGVMGTVSAHGNGRNKDNHHNSHQVAPPRNNHRVDHVAPPKNNHGGNHVAPPSRVPHGATKMRHNNRDYYWHNGSCYYNNAIVMPPYGLIVPSIPRNYVVVNSRGNSYYYYEGNYYKKHRGGYVVIEPVRGIVIDFMPFRGVVVMHRGVQYYKSNGVYYRIVVDRRNRTTYEVVGVRLP